MPTYTAEANGNWGDAGTWSAGGPPTSTDSAIIAGHTVALTADIECVDLTVGASGILNTANKNITISGNWDQSDITSRCNAGTSTITQNGDGFFKYDGTISKGYTAASLILNGNNTITGKNNGTSGFYNLTCGQNGNTTTLVNATTDYYTGIHNTLTVGSGSIVKRGGTDNVWISLSGTNPNPFTFDAESTVTITAFESYKTGSFILPTLNHGYPQINIQGASTCTQSGNITNNGSIYVYGGGGLATVVTWKTDGYDLTIAGLIRIGANNDTGLKNLDATRNGARASTITVGGTWLNYGTGTAPSQFIADNSTVVFNSTTSGKTITSGGTLNSPFYNVTFNGVGGVWTLQDALVATNLTVTDGTLIDNAKIVTVNGNIAIANSANKLTSTGTWIQAASGNVTNPSRDNSFAVYQINTGVTATKTNTVFTVIFIMQSNSASAGSSGLIISFPRNNDCVDIPSDATFLGYLGFYDGYTSITQKAISITGQIQIYSYNCTITMTGNWTAGSMRVSGNGNSYTLLKAGVLDTNGYNLTINGNLLIGQSYSPYLYYSQVLFRTGTHLITGNLTVDAAPTLAWIDLGSSNMTVGGNIDFTRAIVTPGTSTVIFTGTGTITSGARNSKFNNVQFNGSGKTFTIADDLIANNVTYIAGTLVNPEHIITEENFSNLVQTTLASDINESITSLTVNDGSKFPSTSFRVLINNELIKVAIRMNNVFSGLTRSCETGSSIAAAHVSGTKVTHVVTTEGLTEFTLQNTPRNIVFGINGNFAETASSLSNPIQILKTSTLSTGCGIVLTAPTGSAAVFKVCKNTLAYSLSTEVASFSIAATTGVVTFTAGVIPANLSFIEGDYLTFFCESVGSTITGANGNFTLTLQKDRP